MAFNWEATDTYYFVDQENKMMLTQNPSWKPDGENGKGDAIGRSFTSYVAYEDERFLEGIEACWERVERKGWLKRLLFGKYYYQGYRYPHRYPSEVGLSRDHLTYTLLAFKYAGYSDEFIKEFVTHLRFRISKFALFTPELWLWRKALYSRFYEKLYLLMNIPVLYITKLWNKFVYKIVPFEDEYHPEEFIVIQNELKPKRIRKWAKRLYPIYALHIQAWQLNVLPDSKLKRRAEKIALDLCPKYNYVIQMLLGFKDLVPKEEVDNYKPMRGGRWGGILNPWINDRSMYIIDNPVWTEYNTLDVDYLKKLYNTIQCESS
jgi:hypothetical protein